MTRIDTVSDLFAVAIAAEKAAANLYRRVEKIFAHEPAASAFWHDLVHDEIRHAEELATIRGSLTVEQLNSPAARDVAGKAMAGLARLSELVDLSSIVTLDDAHDIAYELEYSEVNIVFQSLVNEFVPSQSRSEFVLSLLEEHMARFEIFSKSAGDAAWRRTVIAQHQGEQQGN